LDFSHLTYHITTPPQSSKHGRTCNNPHLASPLKKSNNLQASRRDAKLQIPHSQILLLTYKFASSDVGGPSSEKRLLNQLKRLLHQLAETAFLFGPLHPLSSCS